jgi:hypothetical protein
MKKVKQFGETVDGYLIPVLNEREIRAGAGILFLFVFTSFLLIVFKGNFVMIKYVITAFLSDFIIRVFINPKFAPTLILGRMIVSNQVPEYVGSPQKKFAWIIGIVLAAIMFIHLIIINAYSPITGIICLICMVFLFFESAFGICLGCLFYPLVYKKKVQLCPGEVCENKVKEDIQKISKAQILIVIGFAAIIIVLACLFNEVFSKVPFDLFGLTK